MAGLLANAFVKIFFKDPMLCLASIYLFSYPLPV